MAETAAQRVRQRARDIAHTYILRCTGGSQRPGDGLRRHSDNCDSLTAKIASAILNAEIAARADERERCAKIAERYGDEERRYAHMEAREIAAAIRAGEGSVIAPIGEADG